MTNKEYIIQNHVDELLNAVHIYGLCEVCHAIGCADYCKSPKSPHTCKETFESWLDREHIDELLYPIGTIVEVKTAGDKTLLGYYNGTDNNGNHYICSYKENIGKTDCLVPMCTVRVHTNDVAKLIKKVGD